MHSFVYKPHTIHANRSTCTQIKWITYPEVFTMFTCALTFKYDVFCLQGVFIYFIWFKEAIIFWRGLLNLSFQWIRRVFSGVRSEFVYTGCRRRNGQNFGRMFLMLNYTDITQNTYIQSWKVTEIMDREVWNFDSCSTLIDYQIHIKTGRNMWFL